MSKIFVIGIDGSGTLRQRREILERCGLIVASKRLAALLGNTFVPIHPITPIDEAFEQIADGLNGGNVCVLASGDPLFFGIGGKLIDHFGQAKVVVFPALSSLQEAFARFKLSWDDAHIVSLHGRKKKSRGNHLPGMVLRYKKTFAFTDGFHSPDHIAREVGDYLDRIGEISLKKTITMHVAENLGASDEKITSGCLDEIQARTFTKLNVICIALPDLPKRPSFGLSEDEIVHSRGLITKNEVRAIVLHKLRIPKNGVFWDIGGGSGSISLEAAAINPRLTVYTIEHREEEISNIIKNIRTFNLFNIVPVKGRAVDKIEGLPDPDAVFVGGSDGEMAAIVAEAASRLPQGGRLVANGVTEKTVTETPKIFQEHGLSVTSSRVEVERAGPDGSISYNPITIMVGVK